jgi:hypothetical protein
MDPIPDWFMKQLEELAGRQPFGDGQVYLGWASDLLFLPKEMVVSMYEKVRKLGIKLITTHMVKNGVFGMICCSRSFEIGWPDIYRLCFFPGYSPELWSSWTRHSLLSWKWRQCRRGQVAERP